MEKLKRKIFYTLAFMSFISGSTTLLGIKSLAIVGIITSFIFAIAMGLFGIWVEEIN